MGGGGERGPWTAARALPPRALSRLLFATALLDVSESPCQLRFASSASLPGLSCLFGLTHLITAIPTPRPPRVQNFQGAAVGLSALPVSRSSHSHLGSPERLSHGPAVTQPAPGFKRDH